MDVLHTMENHVLVAMPSMQSPEFKRTVVLVCQHNSSGAFGVVLNRPLQVNFSNVLQQLKMEHDPQNEHLNHQVIKGGPLQTKQGFLVHETVVGFEWKSSLNINEGLAITSSKDILEDLAAGEGPERYQFILGCTGWQPGQLEAELMDNLWLLCPFDESLVFETSFPQRWKAAAASLHVDPFAIVDAVGHA